MYAYRRARKSASLRNDARFLGAEGEMEDYTSQGLRHEEDCRAPVGAGDLYLHRDPGRRSFLALPWAGLSWGPLARVCGQTRAFLLMPRERHFLFLRLLPNKSFRTVPSKDALSHFFPLLLCRSPPIS